MKTEVITNIPSAHLDKVRQDYEHCGAQNIKIHQQPTGGYTLIAEYPDNARYPASGELIGV